MNFKYKLIRKIFKESKWDNSAVVLKKKENKKLSAA